MSHLHSVLLLFLSVSVGVGCATVAPDEQGSARQANASPDTVAAAVQDPSPSRNEGGSSIEALREAYVEMAYDAVVRRAHERLRDSLSRTDSVQALMLLGRAEQARGNHNEAIQAFQTGRARAYDGDQSLVRIDRALGESYGALYRWELAASAFRRVLDAQPDDQAARQALAEAYRRSRNWADAQQQYTKLVHTDASNGQWWARLAKCEVELGKLGPAIEHFARAHELLPQSADVALALSRYYRATLQPNAARRVVDTTLAYRSGDARLWRRRADLAFERDEYDRARRAYQRAIATGDSTATPYRRMGMIDVERQQYQRALSALQQSYQKDSTNTRTTLYLGISYLRMDSLQRASSYLQQTIDKEAQGPITEAFVQMGNVNDRRSDVAGAVRAYKMALRLRPERTDVDFHLATLYDEYYREKATAARYYRRFLQASDSVHKRLRTYAQDRLQTLRSTLHMQKGRVSADTALEE